MMVLSSSSFEDAEEIAQKHGKKVENVSPQLSWKDAPRETKSFGFPWWTGIPSPETTFIGWSLT
jgi:hypothetical protein